MSGMTRAVRRVAATIAIAATTCLLAPSAGAQARDPAAAEALFRQGREAVERKDYKTACSKFRESQRLDPALGTLFNIADCEEKMGRLATAWTLFQEVAQRLPADDRRRPIATARTKQLEPRLPRLTINATTELPEGTTVLRDAVELGAASLGAPLPVDPGPHTIVVRAPGHEPAEFDVSLEEAQSHTLAVTIGAKLAEGTDPVKGVGDGKSRTSSKNGLGYVFGGVGLAGLLVGGVTGLMTLKKKSTVDANCDAQKRCNKKGADAADSGKTLGTISTVGLVVGGVGLGLGAYFLIRGGKEGAPETALVSSAGTRGVSVSLFQTF